MVEKSNLPHKNDLIPQLNFYPLVVNCINTSSLIYWMAVLSNFVWVFIGKISSQEGWSESWLVNEKKTFVYY